MTACTNSYELGVESEFPPLKAAWESLYKESQPRNPFLSYAWNTACWGERGGRGVPYLLTAREGKRLVGIAPFFSERRAGFRIVRFIGDGRSDYLGLLTAPDHPGAADALLQALALQRDRWDVAVLRQLGEPYSTLASAPVPAELRGHGAEGTVAPHLAHTGDWMSLLNTGPTWLKRMVKETRRFERAGGSVERLSGSAAQAHVTTVAAIEQASWKGRQGVARFGTPAAQELLRQALTGLDGEMELWLARLEGDPVAFEINFVTPERLWLYQGAYREDARKHSPGAVLDFLSIRRAWEAGVREYDFLAGDEAYKLERTGALRPIRYLALHPPTLRGRLAYVHAAGIRWRLKGYAPVRAAFKYWTGGRGPGRPLPKPAR